MKNVIDNHPEILFKDLFHRVPENQEIVYRIITACFANFFLVNMQGMFVLMVQTCA